MKHTMPPEKTPTNELKEEEKGGKCSAKICKHIKIFRAFFVFINA